MTILKFDPIVIDNLQIDPAAKYREHLPPSSGSSPLFLRRQPPLTHILLSGLSTLVFTVGIYIKFFGGKK